MNNFGFGADPFGKTSGQIMAQQSAIAKAQLPPDPDKTPQDEISGSMGALSGVMKAQKGARDVLGAVRKGQAQVRQGVSAVRGAMQSGGKDGADNLMDHLRANPPDQGFQNANQLGEGARATTGAEQPGSIARPTPSRPAGTDIPDGDGPGITGVRGQQMGDLGQEGDDFLGQTPRTMGRTGGPAGGGLDESGLDTDANMVAGNLPKLNVANTLNNTVGGGAGSTEDAVTSGLSNLHAQVQGMGDKLASVGSKVDAGLDAGIGTAEGVLDAMGPVGDVLGAIAGIFGAVKAHKDKVEEEAHNASEKSQIALAQQGSTTNNTLATNTGRMSNTPTGNMGQQAVQSHF